MAELQPLKANDDMPKLTPAQQALIDLAVRLDQQPQQQQALFEPYALPLAILVQALLEQVMQDREQQAQAFLFVLQVFGLGFILGRAIEQQQAGKDRQR